MKLGLAALGLLLCAAAQAHEEAPETSMDAPSGPPVLRLPGRVVPDPRLDLQVAAQQDGELEPAGAALPLPGETVKEGQVLAWLRPLLTQPQRRDLDVDLAAAQRDELLGSIQIKRYSISEAEHLDVKLPTPALEIITNYRSATALDGELKRALGRRVAVVAPRDAVVLRSPAVAGRVYRAGEQLFELDAPGALAVELLSPDALPSGAPAVDDVDGRRLQLAPLATGYDAKLRAWRGLYAVTGKDPGLTVNQPVQLEFPQPGPAAVAVAAP
jgi:hypothetical protein